MTPFACETLLAELRAAGVSVWVEDADTLNVWPASRLTAEQVEALRQHKPAIISAHRRRIIDLLPSHEVCQEWRRRYANTGSRTP